MRLSYHKRSSTRVKARRKNKVRIRRKVEGTAERPRLCVYRSANNIFVQIIDDMSGKTIVAASSLKMKSGHGGNQTTAKQVGVEIAKLAKDKGINSIVFDRSGYVYHGRIKALADGAREGGLNF